MENDKTCTNHVGFIVFHHIFYMHFPDQYTWLLIKKLEKKNCHDLEQNKILDQKSQISLHI